MDNPLLQFTFWINDVTCILFQDWTYDVTGNTNSSSWRRRRWYYHQLMLSSSSSANKKVGLNQSASGIESSTLLRRDVLQVDKHRNWNWCIFADGEKQTLTERAKRRKDRERERKEKRDKVETLSNVVKEKDRKRVNERMRKREREDYKSVMKKRGSRNRDKIVKEVVS